MQSGVLTYAGSNLNVVRLGSGPKLLLAFHELGTHAADLAYLEPLLGTTYTIIALDLPKAGVSTWIPESMDKQALVTIIERFKLESKVEHMDVLAFGAGTLYGLTLLEQRCEWIGRVLLINLLGLQRNTWPHIVMKHFWAQPRIASAVENPSKTDNILKSLSQWGVIKKEWMPQVKEYISNEHFRNLWLQFYPTHVKMLPEVQKVRWQVKKHQIPLRIYIDENAKTTLAKSRKFGEKQDTYTEFRVSAADMNNKNLISSWVKEFFIG